MAPRSKAKTRRHTARKASLQQGGTWASRDCMTDCFSFATSGAITSYSPTCPCVCFSAFPCVRQCSLACVCVCASARAYACTHGACRCMFMHMNVCVRTCMNMHTDMHMKKNKAQNTKHKHKQTHIRDTPFARSQAPLASIYAHIRLHTPSTHHSHGVRRLGHGPNHGRQSTRTSRRG